MGTDHSVWKPSRRAVLGTAAAGSLATLSPRVAHSAASTASNGEIIDLGVPMREINVRYARAGHLADGQSVIFALNDGNPVSFNVLSIDSGEVIDAHELPPDSIGASLVQHPVDNSVYFSVRGATDGLLLRYVPEAQEVQTIAAPVAGEVILRTLVVDPSDGVLYGCTYPNAKVFSYDPATDDIHDYGSMVSDGDYAWGFDLVHGKLWAGTGQVTGRLIELDPLSGEKTEIALPDAHAATATLVSSVHRREDLVLVMASPDVDGKSLLVFDANTREWSYEDSVPAGTIQASGAATSSLDSNGVFYFMTGGEIYAYDVAQRQSAPVGFADSDMGSYAETTRTVEVVESGSDDSLTRELVGIQQTGAIWRFDLDSQAGSAVDGELVGSPATVHSLGLGPDDKIYVGAYLSSGVMARVSTASYEIEQLDGPDQSDATYAHRGGLIVTSYPNAIAHYGRPTDPWEWGTNPGVLFDDIGKSSEHQQDRIFSVTSIQGRLVFGTVPDYGQLGGALVFSDLDGNVEVHRHVVQDHSISALATRGPLLFAGTTINGGIDAEPTADEAVLFMWDNRAGAKIFETIPVPGARVIQALLMKDDSLWGMTDTGVIFEFDLQERAVVRSTDTGLSDTNRWGRLGSLYYRAADNQFYGNSGRQLFRLDPETLECTILTDQAKVSILAPTGEIFFGDDERIYVYRP